MNKNLLYILLGVGGLYLLTRKKSATEPGIDPAEAASKLKNDAPLLEIVPGSAGDVFITAV